LSNQNRLLDLLDWQFHFNPGSDKGSMQFDSTFTPAHVNLPSKQVIDRLAIPL
jgi:hypothetical protein